MTAFETGFFKEASEYGLSKQQTDYILKRALDHDEAYGMFKSLPDNQKKEQEEEDPSDLADLAEMLRQDFIDRHMSAMQHKIQL
jgi:hypothetical protein